MFGPLASLLWIAFAVLWIVSSETLGHILDVIQGLPLILEILLWIVFLPWMGSLYIWATDWPLWLRVVLIVIIALITIGSFSGGRRARRRSR